MTDFDTMSPADHWEKIQEITKTLKVQVQDLDEKLKDFGKHTGIK